MLAHGFQVINFLGAVILIVFALVVFVLVSRDKSRALTVAFVAGCFLLSALLLYLILVPQMKKESVIANQATARTRVPCRLNAQVAQRLTAAVGLSGSLSAVCQVNLAGGHSKRYFGLMTDKQAVLDALQRLPENASLEEIAEELRIMAAVRRGRADVAAGRTKTHREVQEVLESWATAWTSK
jgi:predicted transcriptional regulator